VSGKPSSFARPSVFNIDAYVPGEQINEPGWIKLNTNECPYPPSPLVMEAMQRETDRFTLYPDPPARGLRSQIAEHWRIAPGQVIAGNGSDDILNLLVRVFSGPGLAAGAMDPSYSLYRILAAANDTRWIDVPFEVPFRLPVDRIVESGCNLFFLTCPHAPSGVAFPVSEIDDLAGRFDGILVVDEAYGDFSKGSAVSLLKDHENLFVTRSFSKSFGLAGLRVGYGIGSEEAVGLLDRVRDSYNLDRFAQAAATAALRDWGYFEATIGKSTYVRDFYRNEFEGIGWKVYPSQANFLFVRPEDASGRTGPEIAESLFSWLKRHKILVRHFGKHSLTRDFLRISIGDEDQMLVLWEVIQKWRKEE